MEYVRYTGHVIIQQPIISYVLSQLLSACSEKHRTLGNATVGRLITFCTVTHCVMMPWRWADTMQYELFISSWDLGSCSRFGALVTLTGTELQALSHLWAAEEEQLFVCIQEHLFLPREKEGWQTGWHVSRELLLLCVEGGEVYINNTLNAYVKEKMFTLSAL